MAESKAAGIAGWVAAEYPVEEKAGTQYRRVSYAAQTGQVS